MRLFLTRHGETEWNRLGKTQGMQNTCLSDLGRVQAKKLGEYLEKKEQITAIYCSDLLRARETAEIIGNQLQLNPISDPLLRRFPLVVGKGCLRLKLRPSTRANLQDGVMNYPTLQKEGRIFYQSATESTHL